MSGAAVQTWQILDVGSIWMREFASAMARVAEVTAWWPEIRNFGAFEGWERQENIPEPPLAALRFPLQRGYARTPLQQLLPFHLSLLKRLRAHTRDENTTGLICTTPFYAPVAEQWRGPVVYYVTDYTPAYASLNAEQVKRLDRRMCRAAMVVCANSRRIVDYLIAEAGCDPERIGVVPNATRASNISPQPLLTPGPLPGDVSGLVRPVAGVIGNLSGNMDWPLLEGAVQRTPWLQWVFVGPTLPIKDRNQAAARERLFAARTTVFTGSKPYGELQAFARAFDVAVLPYLRLEPTYSGSSTRFYEHVAACRPMVATRGFAELLEKPPLLELVDTAEEMAQALEALRAVNFQDGHERSRWEASLLGTWEERVRMLMSALADHLS